MADDLPVNNEQLAELMAELLRLQKKLNRLLDQNEKLSELVREQNRRIAELEEENAELRRAAKRQAAPFRRRESKNTPKKKQKRPGRRAGHQGACRPRPSPEEVDHIHDVPLVGCPCCGGEDLDDIKPVVQVVEDVEIRKVTHQITTYSGHCDRCGRVRSEHPLQVSNASGAASVQLGPKALSFALDLNKNVGVSTRKTCEVMSRHLDIELTHGGLIQASHRVADRLEGDYQELIEQLRRSDAVYVDETSWWVGGPGWWLWGATNEEATVFRVEPKRNREVVTDLLTDAFSGVLSSDCLNIYDNLSYRQNKCYAHHLRAISDAISLRPESEFLKEVELLLKTALAYRSEDQSPIRAGALKRLNHWADRLLQGQKQDKVEEKVRNRLIKQRAHLFTFLTHPEVDATNNAAERALRPAVITRKISCGNRTVRGKKTWEILASLAATHAGSDHQGFSQLIEQAVSLHPEQPNAPPD